MLRGNFFGKKMKKITHNLRLSYFKNERMML